MGIAVTNMFHGVYMFITDISYDYFYNKPYVSIPISIFFIIHSTFLDYMHYIGYEKWCDM